MFCYPARRCSPCAACDPPLSCLATAKRVVLDFCPSKTVAKELGSWMEASSASPTLLPGLGELPCLQEIRSVKGKPFYCWCSARNVQCERQAFVLLVFCKDSTSLHQPLSHTATDRCWGLDCWCPLIFDIYIWHLHLTFIFDIYIWHLHLTSISDIYIWHLYLTFIFDIYISHCFLRASERPILPHMNRSKAWSHVTPGPVHHPEGETFISDIYFWHVYLTLILDSYISDIYIWHLSSPWYVWLRQIWHWYLRALGGEWKLKSCKWRIM